MFNLIFVTPEKRIVVGQHAEFVTIPALKGELNIHPGHAPLVTTLETGMVTWKLAGDENTHKAVITGGYCEIGPDGVSVLAEFADLPGDYEKQEADQLVEATLHALAKETLDDEKYDEALVRVKRINLYKTLQ